MKRELSCIGCWVMMNLVCAQVIHNVRVVEYKGDQTATPLSNVEVVVNGAGSTITDRYGRCTLRFPAAKPGDQVFVRRIAKPGYTLFDNEVVNHWYLPNDTTPITLTLCSTEWLQRLQNHYLQTLTQQQDDQLLHQEQALQKQQNAGLISQAEYKKKVKELYDQYEERLNDIKNYVERFSHLNLSNLNQKEQQIIQLVEQGKLEEAINQYDKFNLLRLYQQKVADLQRLQEAGQKMSNLISQSEQRLDTLLTVFLSHLQMQEDEANRLCKEGDYSAASTLLAQALKEAHRAVQEAPDSIIPHVASLSLIKAKTEIKNGNLQEAAETLQFIQEMGAVNLPPNATPLTLWPELLKEAEHLIEQIAEPAE